MDLSPAQLLMSRRLRSNLPMAKSLLSPQVNENVKDNLEMRHRSKNNTTIVVQNLYHYYLKLMLFDTKQDLRKWQPGVVVGKHTTLRSYYIRTANGNMLRRNRQHIKRTSESSPELDYSVYDDQITDDPQELPPSSDTADQSRSSESSEAPTKTIKVPLRYRDMTDT